MSDSRSNWAEKISAASMAATALAAAKTAEEARRVRVGMEDLAESQRQVARLQQTMAGEQTEHNFRNAILATLPLLKNAQESTQFLIEQLLPKLKERVKVSIPDAAAMVFDRENVSRHIDEHIRNDTIPGLKGHLAAGKELFRRIEDWRSRSIESENKAHDLKQARSKLQKMERFAFFYAFGRKRKMDQQRAEVNSLATSDDSVTIIKDKQELDGNLKVLEEKWIGLKLRIVDALMEAEATKTKAGMGAASRIENLVAAQIRGDVEDLQSFLPPSARLQVACFAQCFFDEAAIRRELLRRLTPDYSCEKVTFGAYPSTEDKLNDGILALLALGYKQIDAHDAIRQAQAALGSQAGVEELVRACLRKT